MKAGLVAPALAAPRLRPPLLLLASPRLTPYALLLLGAAAVAVYGFDDSAAPWLAAPLLLLAANLVAAVATNGVFRRQLPLLMFHLALIALVLLAALGRLSYLKGRVELAEGSAFAGLLQVEQGPLHAGQLASLNFVNDGTSIDYMAGPVLDRLVNRVRWQDGAGQWRAAAIETNHPLVVGSYRIYPTSNKGFAPLLMWRPHAGAPVLAALHLPSYPANAASQARSWQPDSGGAPLWVMLPIDETIVASDRPSQFRLPAVHDIVVRRGQQRWTLAPGQQLALADGVLEYRALRTWMGYRVAYDWTIPWLLAACAVAIACMAWHFWTRFAARPWDKEE